MLVDANGVELNLTKAIQNFTKSIHAGLLKVFSKMGISTLMSYRVPNWRSAPSSATSASPPGIGSAR